MNEGRERPEPWAFAAYVLAAAFLGLIGYLGSRPGGTGPLYAYRFGPPALALAALVVLAAGIAWSAVRRPVLQRRRRLPFLCAALVFGVVSYPVPYPSSHEGRPSTVRFRLPVEGTWTVFWGGEKREHNRLVGFAPDQRFGLHLVVAEGGRTHRGDGLAAEDYLCFGRPVLAPAAGVVVRAVGDLPDLPPRRLPPPGTPPLGNHVVVEVAPGQYAFLASLRSGSLSVSEGDEVAVGQPIGRAGNSGFSRITPEPHVAAHLQDTPDPLWGEAIPWRFHGYRADGRVVERGVPRGGIGRGGELLGQEIQPGDG